jgi:hypothetical protein
LRTYLELPGYLKETFLNSMRPLMSFVDSKA